MDSARRHRQTSTDICSIKGGYLGACCVMTVVGVGLCISQIIVGSLYYNSCPSQPMVPVFLIVGGSTSLLFMLTCRPSKLTMCKLVLKCEDAREGVMMLVFGVLFTCWLLVGTVFIVRTSNNIERCDVFIPPTASTTATASVLQRNSTVSTSTLPCPYCHDTVLNFAYSVMITEWCIVVLFLLSWPCNACMTYVKDVPEEASISIL